MEENTKNENPKKKKFFALWVSIFVVCTLCAAACVGYFVYHRVLRASMNDLYDRARTVRYVKSDSAPGEDSASGGISYSEDEKNGDTIVTIDFNLLRETGPDVYAWIEIPGTDIAYPIVQHPKNNSYYLRRAINGSYDVTGCIYTQNYNSRDFSDPNTVIYGHYMSDGTKFGSLLKYMDRDYFDEYKTVMIYTESEVFEYEIFAAVPFGTKHILLSYNYASEKTDAFLDEVYAVTDSRANFSAERSDVSNDKLITLSTCLKNSSRRFLVIAKLVKTTPVEGASSVG